MSTAPWAPIPGPADRVTFLEEQKTRRRQAGRFTALAGVAAAIVGVPLAMFLTPVAFLVLIVALRLAPPFAVTDHVWTTLRELAQFVPNLLSALADAPDDDVMTWLRAGVTAIDYPFDSPALAVAAMILPGMATMTMIWLGDRTLFRSVGVGGALLALGAREPRADDFEERQLVNVVDEMAVAAGLRAPTVRLIDSDVPNAAAVGSSPDDAVIVISRGVLDRMDRDETQGVIAHLVGSIGNGDLGMALSITTVFQAVELVFTVTDALFNLSPSAWRSLWWTLRLIVSGGADRRAAEIVATMMDHRIGEMREDGISAFLGETERDHPRHWAARLVKRLPWLYAVFMPFLIFYLLTLFLRMQVSMFRLTVVGPLLMRVWRTRRYLADATGVQLTRYPEGLAKALGHLAGQGAVVPGGQWFAHLFIVGPEAAATGKTWSKELSGVPSHPSIPQRVWRLGALGARIHPPRSTSSNVPPPQRPRAAWLGGLSIIIFGPLAALAAVLMVFAMSAIFMFGLVGALFFMGIAMAGIHALLT